MKVDEGLAKRLDINHVDVHACLSVYSKTCVKRPLKKDNTKILMTNGSLLKVKSIAECSPLEHSEILLACIKR